MASRVPIELYRLIIENITDRKTLLSLALTSQVINFEAERALYDTISNIFETDSYIRVFEHLIACPRVARLVRHLHIILRTHIPAGHNFYTLLSTALHGLPSLKTLVFRGVGECQEAHLPLNSPFQLEHIDWLATSPELPRFLAQQPGLKTLLNVHLTPEHEPIALDALHELSTVSGDLATINALLPGRRVKNLHWISTDKDEKNPDVSVLADAFRGLESIRLGGHFHRHPLGLVAEYLSNVTSLELFGVQPDDLGYVCQLPRLEELKLSSQWGSSMSPIPLGDSATIAKLFAGAKTLKRVLVALPVYWPLQAFCQAYEVWHLGDTRPEIVNNGMCL